MLFRHLSGYVLNHQLTVKETYITHLLVISSKFHKYKVGNMHTVDRCRSQIEFAKIYFVYYSVLYGVALVPKCPKNKDPRSFD